MSKLILLLSICVFLQVATTSPRGVLEDAERLVEELKIVVRAAILDARRKVTNAEQDFLTYSDTKLTTSAVLIEQQEEAVQQQLTTIKNLANSANADISACTDIREEQLNRLPSEYNDLLRSCIVGVNRIEAGIVSDAMYTIDIDINKVHHIEFQIIQCKEELFCIVPLLSLVGLEKIRMPQQINSKAANVENLLKKLKLSIQSCADDNVSEYATNSDILLNEITVCANTIID